jgi:hypothetical protein
MRTASDHAAHRVQADGAPPAPGSGRFWTVCRARNTHLPARAVDGELALRQRRVFVAIVLNGPLMDAVITEFSPSLSAASSWPCRWATNPERLRYRMASGASDSRPGAFAPLPNGMADVAVARQRP